MQPKRRIKPLPSTAHPRVPDNRPKWRRFFEDYFWWVLKNLIGWGLILLSPVLGVLVPGPGGLPIFLLGFALVTFPGKRRLTARILYGRPLPLSARVVSWIASVLAITVPALVFYWLARKYIDRVQELIEIPLKWLVPASVATYLLSVIVVWVLTRAILWLTNKLLRLIPRIRRKLRPWLRKQGIHLLPSRAGLDAAAAEQEIVVFDQRHKDRVNRLLALGKTWGKRVVGIVITVGIFWWMAKPIYVKWDQVAPYVRATNPWKFLAASAMFAAFLFAFRAIVWRRILVGFGHTLPMAPALRIWITSELARYIPGSIMQVVGRVILAKPYGVPGTTTSTSQILELVTFLLANVIVAVGCLLWLAKKEFDGQAALWLGLAVVLLPTLAAAIHPKVFYGVANACCRKLGKPEFTVRLSGRILAVLLLWSILGLLWQSLAIWLLVGTDLHIKAAWWWRVAGAYCLAWIAGFLAFTNPGGLGVRELVFYLTLNAVIPASIKDGFSPDREVFRSFVAFLGILLRLWTIAGELMLTAIAYALDWKGAMSRTDAPGRVGEPITPLSKPKPEPTPLPTRSVLPGGDRASGAV